MSDKIIHKTEFKPEWIDRATTNVPDPLVKLGTAWYMRLSEWNHWKQFLGWTTDKDVLEKQRQFYATRTSIR